MAELNFQKQVASMKKLREMVVKAYKYSEDANHEYILLGGEASVSGVEANLRTSVAQLDRMIKDCEGRVMWEQRERKDAAPPGKKRRV